MIHSIIIEHPTRGTLREWDGPPEDRSFRFSWSGARNDPEKAHQLTSVNAAIIILNGMPDKLRASCRVMMRRSGEIEYKPVG